MYIIESAYLLAMIDELQPYPKRFTPAKRIIEELGEDGPPVYCCGDKGKTPNFDRRQISFQNTSRRCFYRF